MFSFFFFFLDPSVYATSSMVLNSKAHFHENTNERPEHVTHAGKLLSCDVGELLGSSVL